MSAAVSWEAANNEYLAARLAWLREVLENRPEEAARWLDEVARLEAAGPRPALLELKGRLGLSRFECDVLWLTAAMELDPSVAGLCARAAADGGRGYPTFALALSIFEEPAWEALSPERPLRYWRLIEIHQSSAQPLTTSALRAEERIVNYLKGLNHLDDRLSAFVGRLTARDHDLVPTGAHAAAGTQMVAALRRSASSGYVPVVQLQGGDVSGKQALATRVAAELGLTLYRLPADLLPTAITDLDSLARLWQRESALSPIALYVDAFETERTDDAASPIARFLNRINGVVFVDTRDSRLIVERPLLIEDVPKPAPFEQEAAWQRALGDRAVDNPARLAAHFNLGLDGIRRIATTAVNQADPGDAAALEATLWRACLLQTRPRLDALARRSDSRAAWGDLVLPAEQLAVLHQIATHVEQRRRVYDEWGFRDRMTRGLGISALFAGESGTGKTFAAEVLGNELGLHLYRIDLSAVVSKYIGETEKNLRRLFDAAEDGGAILFFDEADALFGKRSEVKDSHDRYANIEVNYLLQRMEAFGGLAILATNMRSALDTAFIRRIRFIVSFPFPGPFERKRMWRQACPAAMPLEGIDFDRLARLTLTGGAIHNIVLNAAFLAAADGGPLRMSHMLSAARAEFVKMDRPISETDFAWHESAGAIR